VGCHTATDEFGFIMMPGKSTIIIELLFSSSMRTASVQIMAHDSMSLEMRYKTKAQLDSRALRRFSRLLASLLIDFQTE
jgi:hypothetical protein